VRLPAYPSYKLSGIEWLGQVPAHWAVKRLKNSATCWVSNVDKVPAEEESPVKLVNYTDVYYNENIRPDLALMETTATQDEIKRFGLEINDVLITKDSEEWSDIAIPALVVDTTPDLVCGYHLAIIRPTRGKLLGRFLLRAFQSCAINQQFQVAASGVTRYGLPKSAIGEAWVPIPSLEEQHAIAAFLDRETARLNTLVDKNRTLIEKLKEKRSALISQTVTRGLPPDAARAAGLYPHPNFKTSGIDWLGDVPEHWAIKPLKSVARIGNGSTPNRENADYWDDGDYPWLNSAVVNQETVTQAEECVTALALAECHLPRIQPPAVLVGITGQGRTRGMATTLLIEATINQHLAFVKPSVRLADVGFVRRVFDMAYGYLRSESDGGGSTKGAITCEQIKGLRIPAPSVSEQAAIAEFLDRETAKIDSMVAKVEEAIERLKEYRTALITAAVTGKIDVRNAGKSAARGASE
jgi:type I restriction enzyme, S subunit